MKASIVIPAYKPDHLLRSCLQEIINYTDLSDVEVIVICNGSNRESANMILDLGGCFKLVWYPEAIGFTSAANIGFKLARSEHIIIMNTDAHLLTQEKDSWINKLLNPLNDPKVGITGLGMMWTEYGGFLPFFCTGIKRSLFHELGYLDERFNPGYCEDADFCFRARKAGYEVLQVDHSTPNHELKINVSDFPLHHAGEQSFMDKEARRIYNEKGHSLLKEIWGQK